jgi:hypothetical protein
MVCVTGVTVKYEPREEWDEPRSFEAFLASSQFVLQPWPERAVPLDEAMSKVKDQTSPGKAADHTGKKSSKKSGTVLIAQT